MSYGFTNARSQLFAHFTHAGGAGGVAGGLVAPVTAEVIAALPSHAQASAAARATLPARRVTRGCAAAAHRSTPLQRCQRWRQRRCGGARALCCMRACVRACGWTVTHTHTHTRAWGQCRRTQNWRHCEGSTIVLCATRTSASVSWMLCVGR